MSSADSGGIYIDMAFYMSITFSAYDISLTIYESQILAQPVTHFSPAPIPTCGPQEYTYHEMLSNTSLMPVSRSPTFYDMKQ